MIEIDEIEAKTALYKAKQSKAQAESNRLTEAYIDDLLANIQGDVDNGEL